jgi:hypothetical protein
MVQTISRYSLKGMVQDHLPVLLERQVQTISRYSLKGMVQTISRNLILPILTATP